MKLAILSSFSLCLCLSVYGQNRMIVFFKDKGNVSIDSDQRPSEFLAQFTSRSIERRAKYNIAFDEKDFPVNDAYQLQLKQVGVINSASKWLNAVSFTTDLSPSEMLSRYSFIDRVQLVNKTKSTIEKDLETVDQRAISYGASQGQIEQLNLDCLHDLGYEGEGVYLAIIDAGFTNMNTINYFDTLFSESRVLDTYDFVTNLVDVYGFSGHGTSVSSCIVAQEITPDEYYGTAVNVDVALYRSEDADFEYIEEEFYLVLALERCDSEGVDIANISLGYVDFDDSSDDHPYSDMDGQTTMAAIGVNTAASKGIAIVASAGNRGPETISTPCDADSVLCVGAVNAAGVIADFSSVGPAADGQVKPDVVATGEDAWAISQWGSVGAGNGTSFASPIICGATICLMQANPTVPPMDIFAAIRQSADQYTTPDHLKGYGIPDFCVAHDILQHATLEDKETLSSMLFFPNPTSDFLTIQGIEDGVSTQILVFNSIGQVVRSESSLVKNGTTVLDVKSLGTGVYIIEVIAKGNVVGRERVLISK